MGEGRKRDSSASQGRNIRAGIVFTYVKFAVFFLLSLFYSPYLLASVGKEQAGLYQFAVSIASFILLLSFGTENSYVRFSTVSQEKDDGIGLASSNGFYLVLFGFIAFVELAAGLLFSLLFGIGAISVGSQNLNVELSWLLIINTVAYTLDFFLSLFSWHIYLRSHFAFIQILLIVSRIATVSLSVLSLVLGGGIIWVAIVSAAVMLICDVANVLFAIRKLGMRFVFPKPGDFKLKLREVFSFSIYIFLSMIVSQINANLGKTVLGFGGDMALVAVYAYGFQFYSYEALISSGISDSFEPRINDLVIKKETQKASSLFLKISKIQSLVLLGCIGCYAICGKDFVAIWLGGSDLAPGDFTAIFFLGLGLLLLFAIPLSETSSIEIQRAAGKHRFISVFGLVCSLLNLAATVVSVVLLPPGQKVYGPLIGMAFYAVPYVVALNVFSKKKLNLPIYDFLFFFAIVCLVAIVSASLVYALVSYALPSSAFFEPYGPLLLKALLFVFIYGLLSFLLFRNDFRKAERQGFSS
jgi:O-antigen/teichoic acid export membrane protein